MSSQSDAEETEFDSDAIIVPAPTEEVKEGQKPMLKGKKFCVMPSRNLDSDLSGLCSIMWSDTSYDYCDCEPGREDGYLSQLFILKTVIIKHLLAELTCIQVIHSLKTVLWTI